MVLFFSEKMRKLLKKNVDYDINIKRKTIEKMDQKMEENYVKK